MKDLIKDILQYFKDNEEARNRFNGLFDETEGEKTCFIYKDKISFDIKMTEKSGQYGRYNDFSSALKSVILIHALSSPNGKPICGFLEQKEYSYEIGAFRKINHADRLVILYLDHILIGKSHNEAYKLINKEYNKICQKKQ